ncbi:MAG: twin-arginine translocation signal domain-containing protein, partial [Sphingobacteriaceae bacterium]|nr:twin-arginine translocation signal domain-containing protein [Cytophagaceae bacterium]
MYRRDFLKTTATTAAGFALTANLHDLMAQPRQPLADAFQLRYRQVHLDFHTSEHIAGIGADFDPEKFAATL